MWFDPMASVDAFLGAAFLVAGIAVIIRALNISVDD